MNALRHPQVNRRCILRWRSERWKVYGLHENGAPQFVCEKRGLAAFYVSEGTCTCLCFAIKGVRVSFVWCVCVDFVFGVRVCVCGDVAFGAWVEFMFGVWTSWRNSLFSQLFPGNKKSLN